MIYTPGFMEIEFIILSRGSGSSNVLKTNLGVNAHALRHLQVLKDNALEVDIFGINLAVPAPEAYVLHKMIINKQRGSKSLKDQHVIHKLLPIVDKVKLLGIYREMTKKEQRAVSLYCKEHGYQLLD